MGRAEGGQARMFQGEGGRAREELAAIVAAGRSAGFDDVDAELIQALDDGVPIFHAEGDIMREGTGS